MKNHYIILGTFSSFKNLKKKKLEVNIPLPALPAILIENNILIALE